MMSTKDFSQVQENRISKYLGWTRVVASGARPFYPGDIESDEWLGECKTHVDKVSKLAVSYKVWRKIKDESLSKYKFPVLFVDDGSQQIENTWAVFDISRPCPIHEVIVVDYNNSSKSKLVLNIPVVDLKLQFKNNLDNMVCRFSLNDITLYITPLKTFASLYNINRR